MHALLLFLSLLSVPHLTATWARPGVARLAWVQPSNTQHACLTRITESGRQVPLDCYDNIPPGAHVTILLGATGPLDGEFRPALHDSFIVSFGATSERAPLRGVVRLPVVVR